MEVFHVVRKTTAWAGKGSSKVSRMGWRRGPEGGPPCSRTLRNKCATESSPEQRITNTPPDASSGDQETADLKVSHRIVCRVVETPGDPASLQPLTGREHTVFECTESELGEATNKLLSGPAPGRAKLFYV